MPPSEVNNKAKGYFDRSRFKYIRDDDEYECPAGERLTHRTTTMDGQKTIRRYWSSACGSCAIKSQCTNGKERRVSRWVHEDVLERAAKRLRRNPEVMNARRSLVEHPFGTRRVRFEKIALEIVGYMRKVENIDRCYPAIGELSHSLGRKQTFDSPDFQPFECPLWSKTDITNCSALAIQQLWLPLATRTSK